MPLKAHHELDMFHVEQKTEPLHRYNFLGDQAGLRETQSVHPWTTPKAAFAAATPLQHLGKFHVEHSRFALHNLLRFGYSRIALICF